MGKTEAIFVVTILMTVTFEVTVQHCTKKHLAIFEVEPKDVEVTCEADRIVTFACQYNTDNAADYSHLQWIINSVEYNITQLPPNHSYDGRVLTVRNINLNQHNSSYQCQLLSTVDNNYCAHKSTVGRLIIKCQAFDVQCLPSYHFQNNGNTLKEIVSTISQEMEEYLTTYEIQYIDFHSGKLCGSETISPSSCVDGTCTSVFYVSTSSCPSDSHIIVVVCNDRGLCNQNPIIIESVNKFFEGSFIKKVASTMIKLNFLNQPKESEKWYSIRYGPANPGCRELPSITKGHLSNSPFISVELNHGSLTEDITEFSICFEINVISDKKTVKMEGTYDFGMTDTDPTMILVIGGLVCGTVIIILMALVFAILCYAVSPMRSKHQSERDIENSPRAQYHNTSQVVREPVDLSTTYYWIETTTKEGSLHDFAKAKQKQKPNDSFMYIQAIGEKGLKKAAKEKRVILMDKAIPKFTISGSAIAQDKNVLKGEDVYIHKKLGKEVPAGTAILYCVRSKDITAIAYWRVFDITEECEESQFMKQKMPGFKEGWIHHCYFEFTKSECIKHRQNIIVINKDNKLFTGPGIRHLLDFDGHGSKTTATQPPDFQHHEGWQRVFIQSDEDYRILYPGTKYLFCVRMEKVTAYNKVYSVSNVCTMEDFGGQHITGYRQANGYGYFEFTQPEILETHKNVMVMDKSGRLFTGAGAKFFFTGHDYCDDDVSKKKVFPSPLNDKEWKHIFIQSRSTKRRLQPGTKFLYCEYNYNLDQITNEEDPK